MTYTYPDMLAVDLGDGYTATLQDADANAWLVSNPLGVDLYHYVLSDADRYRLADALADARCARNAM